MTTPPSEASQRVAEDVVTKLWVLSLHEQRVEVVATDPVLVGPDLARSPRLVRVTHELGLNPDDVFGGHAGYGCDAIDSELHGSHVAEHRFRRIVVVSNPGRCHRPRLRNHDEFEPPKSDRLHAREDRDQ